MTEKQGQEVFDKAISYTVETEVPVNYAGKLLDFIYTKYVMPQKDRFANVSRTASDSESSLAFAVADSAGNRKFRVEITGGKPLKVRIIPLNETVTEQAITEVKQDIAIAVELFEEKVRENTLYFAWREGEDIVPERISGKEKKPINRLFLETQVFLAVIFISLGLFLFFIMGWWAPIVLMGIQLVFVFFSNKLIERTADWHITKDDPNIHVLEYRLPLDEHDDFRKRFSGDELVQLKKEVYEQTISKKGEIDCETTGQIFKKHAFECRPEDLSSRKVNVYKLVEKTAQKFGFPMPSVVVSNTLIPNAAASGPSPSRGVVLITTGLLVQLKEDEILSVLGHEFGHLKGRDPLLLYGLMGTEFLFRFYVLLPLFPILFSSILLFFLYFWAVMTVIYFIAKFFEARADLTSAMVVGQPQVLAEALEKIGFKRLLLERVPAYRIEEWVSFDPHPPIYFRVNRLRKLAVDKIRHPFLQSLKEVTKGFLDSL